MSDINVGRVRPLFRGAYNAATTYNWWDVAKYDGTWWLYISTTSAAGITPSEGSTWTAFGTKGDTTVATDITGNAATATKAATCIGNSATATKLETARTINGASFDGTANIQIMPVGALIPFAGSSAPAHCLLANGAAVSRTTYAELFGVIGTLYGSGDGSTTFNLPNFANGQFIRGTGGNAAALGSGQAEGLPDIQGDLVNIWTRDFSESGAFYYNTGGYGCNLSTGTGTYDYVRVIKFAASSYNNIYGSQSHVTPVNNAATICIVYE